MHRDIKPENILLNTAEDLRLADFGLSKQFKVPFRKEEEINVGSIPYMAPEQLAQRKDCSVQVDMWAVGCTMFYLMTKKLLCPNFREETQKELGEESESGLSQNVYMDTLNRMWIKKTLVHQVSIFGLETFEEEQILDNETISEMSELREVEFVSLETTLNNALNDALNEGKTYSDEAKDLLKKLLEVSPDKRIHAKVALEHPWFELEIKKENLN